MFFSTTHIIIINKWMKIQQHLDNLITQFP